MEKYDLIGVGIGPANLSLAALLIKVPEINARFFDRNSHFEWHGGLLFSDAKIQVNFLKDLVTLVDPTNPYSFIAYLVKKKRIYRFINVRFDYVLRAEFNEYYAWVSQSLKNLSFAEEVNSIEFMANYFRVKTNKRHIYCRDLVLGTGLTPKFPQCVVPHLSQNIFHGHYFRYHKNNYANKRITIVGGGQSGAEIVRQLLADNHSLPERIHWITRRSQLLPVDYSTFVTEFFFPNYADYFYQQQPQLKNKLLQQQELASDGISESVLEEIYKRLYIIEYIEKKGRILNLHFASELNTIYPQKNNIKLRVIDKNTNLDSYFDTDIVILCTGYEWCLPECLLPIKERLYFENNKLSVCHDYSIEWNGPSTNRIYVQNAARHTHGISDPNISLIAFRSAKIINSIMNAKIYDIDQQQSAIDWQTQHHEALNYACS